MWVVVRRGLREDVNTYFLDIAGAVDSPASKRGIRRRGGKDTVPINHSKKSVKIVGALGMGTLDIQFHEKANSESVIALLEYLRRRYGGIFVILDNAAAHTSAAMREYIGRAGGDVVLWFLPPRTPQHNSIEVEWREIKRAISEAFFGRFDKLQERIRQLLRSGEVPIVKILDYVLNAARNQKGPWKRARPMPVEPPECAS